MRQNHILKEVVKNGVDYNLIDTIEQNDYKERINHKRGFER